MSGRWLPKPTPPHVCDKPDPEKVYTHGNGDLWQCDDCEKIWRYAVIHDQREGTIRYWASWSEGRRPADL